MHLFEQKSDNDAANPAALFRAAVAARRAAALWRLPNQTGVHGVVDLSDAPQPAAIHFQCDEPGFVFAPFSDALGRQPLLLRADVYLTPTGIRPAHSLWNGRRQRFDEFLAHYEALHAAPAAQAEPCWYTPSQSLDLPTSQLSDYRRLVAAALRFILDNGLKKVVVSRTKAAALPPNFDPAAMFTTLGERYPAAFVSLVAIPDVGTWIGASPELLLTADARGLHTVALAGTQTRPAGEMPLEAVHWSSKEIEEQALVADYIRDFFRRADVNGVEETGPRTVAAGNVVHLRSDFCVELSRPALLGLADRVLHELHPTSAVCGMPKDKALAFILAHEGYDRSFYSGFLGPMHLDGASHLYVNLRCMQLDAADATLYMGGGVTADSQPDAEWRETELKARTLLDVLYPAEKVESQSLP